MEWEVGTFRLDNSLCSSWKWNILFYLCSKSSSLQLSLELGNALTVDKRLIALYSSVRRSHGQQPTTTCGGGASHSQLGKWIKKIYPRRARGASGENLVTFDAFDKHLFVKDFYGPVTHRRSFLFNNCRTENGNIKHKRKTWRNKSQILFSIYQ